MRNKTINFGIMIFVNLVVCEGSIGGFMSRGRSGGKRRDGKWQCEYPAAAAASAIDQKSFHAPLRIILSIIRIRNDASDWIATRNRNHRPDGTDKQDVCRQGTYLRKHFQPGGWIA